MKMYGHGKYSIYGWPTRKKYIYLADEATENQSDDNQMFCMLVNMELMLVQSYKELRTLRFPEYVMSCDMSFESVVKTAKCYNTIIRDREREGHAWRYRNGSDGPRLELYRRDTKSSLNHLTRKGDEINFQQNK
jgi:hypothetical protein